MDFTATPQPDDIGQQAGRAYLDEAAEARMEAGRRWDALADEERRAVAVALVDLTQPGHRHKVALALNS